MAFLGIMSGVIGALKGAVQIASMFKTQSSESIVGSGSGTGFWKYYSNSAVGTRSVAANRCGDYIDLMIGRIMNEATPALQSHTNEIIADLQDISEFESYVWGECDNMINTVNYNQGAGQLYMYVYTFSPFIHETRGEAVKIQTMKIRADMKLAQDWIIVQKTKASFFKATSSQEIQYLPQKGIQTKDIVDAISIAMAPAVLGLVQLPERFMTVLDSLLKQQMDNPNAGVVTAPSAEQTQQAYEQFKEMRAAQDAYTENALKGFDTMSDAIKELGNKGTDLQAP